MNSTLVPIVTESHHEISNVDDNCALDWGGLNPLPFSVKDLQTPNHILVKKSKELEIRMTAKSDCVVGGFLCGGHWIPLVPRKIVLL